MTPRDMLEYLRRKGCAMQLGRIREDFTRPEPEVLAVLGVLLRERKVRCPRPGEYEAVPMPLPGHEPVSDPRGTGPVMLAICTKSEPPADAPAQENPTARGKKRCEKCEQSKGYRAFAAGSDTCNDCAGAKKTAAKPQGGVRQPRAAVNGKSLGDIAAKHAGNGSRFAGTVEQLRAEAAKYAAAADALEALGR